VWHSPTRSESLSNAVKSNMSQSSIRAGLGGRADWAGPWGVAARGVARRANMAGANQAHGFDEALALTPACVCVSLTLTLTLTACRPKTLQKLKSSRPLDYIPHFHFHFHSHSSHPQLIHFHSLPSPSHPHHSLTMHASRASIRAFRAVQTRNLHMTGPATFSSILTSDKPTGAARGPTVAATTPAPSAAESKPIRHFNTSRSLKAVKDSSTIDFAFIPDFDPDTRSAPVEMRVPVILSTTSARVTETEEPVRYSLHLSFAL
jgi:hypothetical protein